MPVVEQIRDRSAQAGVRLHLLLVQLSRQPLVQLVHHRSAVLLVKEKSFLRRQPLLLGQCVMVVDLTKRFQNVPAGIRKVGCDLDKPPARMR